ncbi:MAG: DUF1570 domain-containing protein [Planctomycetes bacterium]|nr:DUF1570 domain-containing protein [Planctomycetota bacterium]
MSGWSGVRWWSALALIGLAGCHLFNLTPPENDKLVQNAGKEQTPAAPAKHSFPLTQFVFRSELDLKPDQPLFKELSDLRDQVYRDLQLPPSNTPVQVYIFEDREHYERFMHAKYPDLPRRRAFFVAQPRSVGGAEDLLVYTFWGDRIQEDLRHELTHAILHSVLKDVPLWLDEGLAEYFEVPPGSGGVNQHHLALLRREPFTSDLGRLEQLSQVQQMAPGEYREAWAWVHLMLRDRPEAKTVLLNYLQQLRTNSAPGPLEPHLAAVFPSPAKALERHLAQLEASLPPGPTAQR